MKIRTSPEAEESTYLSLSLRFSLNKEDDVMHDVISRVHVTPWAPHSRNAFVNASKAVIQATFYTKQIDILIYFSVFMTRRYI